MIFRIFNKDVSAQSVLLVAGEGLLLYTSVLLAAGLRLKATGSPVFSPQIFGKAAVIMIVCQACLYYNDLYDLKITDTYMELGLRLTKAIGVASIILALLYFLFPPLMISRGVFLIYILIVFVLVVAWRYGYSWVLKKSMFTEKIFILGDGKLSAQIINEIQDRPDCGYRIAGILPTEATSFPSIPAHIPVFSMNGTLCELARRSGTRKITVAMDERRQRLPVKQLLQCKMNGIDVCQGETLYEELTGKLFIEKLNPSWLIFSDGFRKSPVTRVSKRLTGLVMSIVLLALISPLLGIIAIAIKLDSKGPVFFSQSRCGQDGKPFNVLKFRSMIDNAEAETGPQWASDDDWRITRVGHILRKFRLDELPQIINVLKGEMSFVGPRPERPEFVETLTSEIPYYSERHTVKPGITGWAQVSYGYGASVEAAMEKLKYDLFYVKNMSTALDLLVVFRTIKIILHQSGAR